MDLFDEIINNIWVVRAFWTLLVIIISVVIYKIASHILDSHERKKNAFLTNKKNRTFAKMLKSLVRYVLIIADFLIILQIFGVNVSSMLAAAGIAGIVIAFAIKDALQDIVRGFDIVSDNYYNVGDVVKIGTTEGKVLAVGLKTTKIQDINTMNIVAIANRSIIEAEVVSDMIDIDVPIAYEVPMTEVDKVMVEVIAKIKKLDNVTNAEYRKVSNFSPSSMDYRVKVFGPPAFRPQIRRDALYAIYSTLDKHKISVPYPQMELHTSK